MCGLPEQQQQWLRAKRRLLSRFRVPWRSAPQCQCTHAEDQIGQHRWLRHRNAEQFVRKHVARLAERIEGPDATSFFVDGFMPGIVLAPFEEMLFDVVSNRPPARPRTQAKCGRWKGKDLISPETPPVPPLR